MKTQKLIIGVILPLVVVFSYILFTYSSWVSFGAQIQSNSSFCGPTSDYVDMFGIEACKHFVENNITRLSIMRATYLVSGGLILVFGAILSFLSFRQSENVLLDKKTRRLFILIVVSFILLLLTNFLADGHKSFFAIPALVSITFFLCTLFSVIISWCYTLFYFVSSIAEKNSYKIILSLVVISLLCGPVIMLLMLLLRK